MRTLSDGSPSTLGTYAKIAVLFGEEAEQFIKDRIAEAPHGEGEEVIADERQMLFLLHSIGAAANKPR